MTDSLLKLFGYRKNIILELKQRKSKWLMARIILLVPFALAIEAMAAIAGGGGITRNYFYLTE